MAYPYNKYVDVEIYQGSCHPPARFIPLISDCLESRWNWTIYFFDKVSGINNNIKNTDGTKLFFKSKSQFQVSSFFLTVFKRNITPLSEYKGQKSYFEYEFGYRFFIFLKIELFYS